MPATPPPPTRIDPDQPRYANETALNPAPESSWGKLLNQLPRGVKVLDVGCARGAFSAAMQRLRDCRVTGVELDAEAAAEARTRCEEVLCGDIQSLLADPSFPGEFEVIIAADVLEHLLDPKAVLGDLMRKLKPGGVLLASIPNVTHLSVIASLATGRFPRSREGLLDSTHVQFYGEQDAIELFEQSGYAARVVDRVRLDPRLTEFRTDLSSLPPEALQFLEQHRSGDTYQFIIRAVPRAWAKEDDAQPAVSPPEAPLRNRMLVEFAQMEKMVAEYHRALLAREETTNELRKALLESGSLLDAAGRERQEADDRVKALEAQLRAVQAGERAAAPVGGLPVSEDLRPLSQAERARLRVLFVGDRDDASWRYRCIQAAEQLRASGTVANVGWTDDASLADEVKRYSMLVLFRTRWSSKVARLVEAARAAGTTVAFGIDDLIFHPTSESLLPFLRHLPKAMVDEYRALFGALHKTLEASDITIGSTPTLARHLARHGKPTITHPNLLPSAFEQLSRVVYPMRRALIRTPFVGYMSGSKTHDGDLESIAEPLAEAMRQREELQLMLCGPISLPQPLHPYLDRIVHFEYLDFRVYPWLMARCRVALAPLETLNDFTNAKSALKVFEAGAFGVPAIATPTEPYREAIEDGVTGYLGDRPERWLQAILELTDAERSLQFGKRARARALQQFSMSRHPNALARKLLPWSGQTRIGEAPAPTPLGARLDEIRDSKEAYRLLRSSARASLRSPRFNLTEAAPLPNGAEQLEGGNPLLNAIASARREGTALLLNDRRIGDVLADRERPIARWFANEQLAPTQASAAAGSSFESTGDDPAFVYTAEAPVGTDASALVLQLRCTADSPRVAQLFWTVGSDEFCERHSVKFPVHTDGRWRTYRISLCELSWPVEGTRRFRLDPVDGPAQLEVGVVALIAEEEVNKAGVYSVRESIANRFLSGDGIEIGALNNPLKVPSSAYVRYVDRLTRDQCRKEFPELDGTPLVEPSILSEAETLAEVPTGSEQFVIANHVLEHMRDPIGALTNWLRVLRPGGLLYLAIPDRSNPLDKTRPVTAFSHLLEDASPGEAARKARDHDHYAEWTQSVHHKMPPEEQARFTADIERTGYRIHFHVFDLALFERLLAQVVPAAGAEVIELLPHGEAAGAEHVAIIRKRPEPELLDRSPGVDIVVPIYNAREYTQRCVESVLRHAKGDWRLVLVNDCSTDPGIAPDLERFAARDPRVVVLTQPQNQGFVLTANRGMRFAGHRDVLLLNSDTEVFEGFLERLVHAAYVDQATGVLTPFSNNATLCSIPECGKDNPIPEGFTPERFSALVAAISRQQRPEIPTGVGFCMYVKNAVLRKIGYFDEVSFGRGFGEENDLVERAKKAGFTNRLCDDVFVWHKGKASFAAEGKALESKNGAILEAKHPGYHAAVAQFFESNPLAPLHQELRFQLARLRHGAHGAPLFLLHTSPFTETGGGTEFHVRDILRALAFPRAAVAWLQGPYLRVAEVLKGDVSSPTLFRFPLTRGVYRSERPRPDVDAQLLAVIKAFDIQWVHVQHAIDWPLSLPTALAQSGLPVVYTSHDFYAVCPSWNMFDHSKGVACVCEKKIEGPGCVPATCARLSIREENPVELRHLHRQAFQTLMSTATAAIFPSESARSTVGRILDLPERALVIPHGVDLPERPARKPSGERLRVAAVGEVAHAIKGAQNYLDLVARTADAPLEWHFYGTTKLDDFEEKLKAARPEGLHFHGRYQRQEIVKLLAAEGIDLVVLLPAVDETFSFVLSEAWGAGIPVLAVGRGSLPERIRATGAGIVIGGLDEAEARLRELIHDRAALAQLSEKAERVKQLSVQQSVEKLRELYDSLGLIGRLAEHRLDWHGLRTVYDAREPDPVPAPPPAPPPAKPIPSYQKAAWYPRLQMFKPMVPEPIRNVGRLLLERVDATNRLNPGSKNGDIRSAAELEVVRRGIFTTQFVSMGDDPKIEFAINPIQTDKVFAIRFRMKHALSGVLYSQVFWTHSDGENYCERKSAKVDLMPTPGGWHEYLLRLDTPDIGPAWTEAPHVVNLRFDPLNTQGSFEISPLDLLPR